MKNNNMLNDFHTILESKGYRGEIVSAVHIPELLNDIRKFHTRKEIYPELYNQYKSLFEFKPKADFDSIESIIIIAVPVPQFRVTFQWRNKNLSLLVPPTYLYGRKIIEETQDFLENFFSTHGYNITYARLPFKTLAVRSGLARYGRNNITYVPNMGSFYRLCAFYSDLPADSNNWHELKMMDLCIECTACRLACPTKAISDDRFLLYHERCLTYYNEQPGEIPFPQWIQPEWHNCVVGCLYCQKVCPANKDVSDWTEMGPNFTQEETKLFLNHISFEMLPEETKKKLRECELDEYLEVFARNIGGFILSSQVP